MSCYTRTDNIVFSLLRYCFCIVGVEACVKACVLVNQERILPGFVKQELTSVQSILTCLVASFY